MTPVPRALSDSELFDWLRLSRSDNVGPRTFLTLLTRFQTARAALDALPSLGARTGKPMKAASPAVVEAELDGARRLGLRFLPFCDPAYPPSLRVIPAAPPVIAVRGRLDILQRAMVAIVGSRNASAAGLVFTDRLAEGLGRAGYAVVSGLARGIDARAHVASLSTGTVAVLAGGHDRIYPSEHRGLAERIGETGAVLSEMPIGWEPRGRDFPRRNRIVSGLGFGVVVVEAARRSGSLITARFAAEQGREVFAVPGSPLDLRAEGTNDLLRNGASFCTTVEDVTSVLAPMQATPTFALRETMDGGTPAERYWNEIDTDEEAPEPAPPRRVDPNEIPAADDERDAVAAPSLRDRLVDLIGPASVSVNDLVRAAGVPVQAVQAILVELELEGLLRRSDLGHVARLPR